MQMSINSLEKQLELYKQSIEDLKNNPFTKDSVIEHFKNNLADLNKKLEEAKRKNEIMKKTTVGIKEIGEFEIITGEVIISDPCYEIGIWCQTKLSNIKKGNWKALVHRIDEGNYGIRNAYLYAIHESMLTEDIEDYQFLTLETGICVDSGQAGIFDAKAYSNDDLYSTEEFYGDKGFYSACCNATRSDLSANIIECGAVSTSGYGDGSYMVSISVYDGKIIGIKIDFGVEYDEDDEQE